MEQFEFTAELWEYAAPEDGAGAGAWHFLTLPREVSEDVRDVSGPPAGFGSIRVEVSVRSTTWRTSVFPDKRSGCFVLPVKKAVRVAEGLVAGDRVAVRLAVVVDA